ncbi:MAG: zinc-binding dehydrogenase [Firmicutes bacterium]|nr:zinc-binding dehydrogenase [Bacillota bacterium]
MALPSTMKEVKLFGINDLRIIESPVPTIKPDEILVKVRVCGICPTEIRKFTVPNYKPISFPVNPGHEWTGDVVQVGSEVKDFRVGWRVVAEGEGGYAEYAKITASNLVYAQRLPENVSYEEGTFVEPLADCLHAVRERAEVIAGDRVVVIGAGPMGLGIIAVAARSGANVMAVEPVKERRDLAVEFGAEIVVDPTTQDVESSVLDWTSGRRANVGMVTVGIPEVIESGIKLVGERGRVVLFGGGGAGQMITIDPNWIHYKEISLIGSSWIGVGGKEETELYRISTEWISDGKFPVSRLISHRFPLVDIHKAYEAIMAGGTLKVMLLINE